MPGWIEPIKYGKDGRPYLGHTFRYYLARGFLEPTDTVIDCACGCGYGSQILAGACAEVYGYDIDEEALDRARVRYNVPGKTHFDVIDMETVEDIPPCDVFVSFETIEHIDNIERLAPIIRARARRLIIVSTPWRDTKSPHHKRAFFTAEQLYKMFQDDDWALWELVRQGPYSVAVFYRKERTP